PAPAADSSRDLLVSLRARARYPTLLLTLERMDIMAPATYASAVMAAGRLSRADRTLWQFQAALAIAERARAARAIDHQAADTLVRALCAITPDRGGEYRGAVARWIDQEFLGAVGEALLPADLPPSGLPLETRVLAAMAGSVSSPANKRMRALPGVEWEGLKYRLDPGGSTLSRLVQVRERQGGLSLDAVLALARLADAIAAAATSGEAMAAARQLPAAAAPLRRPPHVAWRSPAGDDEPAIDRLAARAIERVSGLGPKPGPRSLANIARPLQEAVDRYLAVVLGSIAYAPHLGEPDGPALLGGDPSGQHQFRFFKPGTQAGRRAAWEVPLETRDQAGWRISGSLLGLDLAIGRLSLRRVSADPLPAAPALSDAERRTFTESALLVSAFDLTDDQRALLLAAVARGRQRVAALDPSSADIPRLAEDAGLDEWRARALAWTLSNEPGRRLDAFSLAELARAGGLDAAAARGLDAWGTSGFSREAGLRPLYPARMCWTTVAGRRGVRAVAALVPDLVIGLAETSARRGLPAPVTAGLLLVATQDFIETLQTAHADDWVSMVAHAQRVARSRTEDYVAALTITGPLVPDDEESDDAWR
ncbi:MAG TPA: hypothetical protein VK911_03745, partial [Vicinamibacterales bacterium]|nr:hypothetical protein [Vicinamibacterales bacterium]